MANDGNILIFAGAGASAAISKRNYPTTVEFYNRLDENIKASIEGIAMNVLYKYIQSQSHDGKPMDIEKVLGYIDELRDHLLQSVDTDSITGILTENTNRDLWNLAHQNIPALGQLKDQIHKEVFRFYSIKPKDTQLKIWVSLIQSLKQYPLPIEIFTTNYDLVLDRAVRMNDINIKMGVYIDDFGRSILRAKFLGGQMTRTADHAGRFTKLHGSINWHKENGNIIVGSTHSTIDSQNHAILYPGFKEESMDQLFKQLYDHLMEVAQETKLAIFIGFSFRDEYINEILKNIPGKVKKIVINTETKENTFNDNFPFDPKSCDHIGDGFSEESLPQILKSSGR